jgi:serine/threonine-protein kinase
MQDYFSGGSLSGFDYVPLGVGTVAGDKRFEILSAPIMGKSKAVYRARDLRFKRDVIFAHFWLKGDDAWQMREREAANLSQLNHPGIVKLLDTGKTEKGMAFLVLEYIWGPTLSLVMRQERRLETTRAVEILVQVANILSYIHKQNLIHGSMKANHIILDQNGTAPDTVRLLDLSLAQQTGLTRPSSNWSETFQLVGNPSPEELRGEPLDARSDFYSMGCLLYKALTGKSPFSGTSADEIRKKHLEEQAPGLKETHPQGIFSPSLEQCVARMMRKEAKDRYQNVDELIADLRSSVRR